MKKKTLDKWEFPSPKIHWWEFKKKRRIKVAKKFHLRRDRMIAQGQHLGQPQPGGIEKEDFEVAGNLGEAIEKALEKLVNQGFIERIENEDKK